MLPSRATRLTRDTSSKQILPLISRLKLMSSMLRRSLTAPVIKWKQAVVYVTSVNGNKTFSVIVFCNLAKIEENFTVNECHSLLLIWFVIGSSLTIIIQIIRLLLCSICVFLICLLFFWKVNIGSSMWAMSLMCAVYMKASQVLAGLDKCWLGRPEKSVPRPASTRGK